MKKFLAILLALVMVLSLVACGDKKDDVDDSNDTPIVDDIDDSSKEQQDNEDKNDEDIDDIDDVKDAEDVDSDVDVNVKDSGKKVEWQIGNITYIYTHDGEKVTGYEARVDMGDVDSAKAVITAYKLNAEEDDTIDDVSRDGQYIVIKYNEKGFEYTSYEDLKSASDMLNTLYGD